MAAFTELLRRTGTSLYDGESLAPDARPRLPGHHPMRHRSAEVELLMRALAGLLALLILPAGASAVAQQKHLIDPTPPGSLNPEPLPPLQDPRGASAPATELFARTSTHS